MESNTHPHQVEIYRSMTPQQKYEAIQGLIDSGCNMKYAYFRSIHPDWPEEQVQKAMRDWFLYART